MRMGGWMRMGADGRAKPEREEGGWVNDSVRLGVDE